MDSSAEFCGAHAEPSIDCGEYRTSCLMDFYRAERIRVLSMWHGLSEKSTASADSRVNASMEDEMEIVNDENVPLERSSVSNKGGRGCKRIAQSVPSLLTANKKRAKFS